MSDLTNLEKSGANLVKDVIGWLWLHGQRTALVSDAAALASIAKKVGAGLRGAAPDAPGLVADCEALIAAGTAVAAARGANLPALEQLAASIRRGYQDLEKAYSDYVAATTIVSTVSPTPPALPARP